MSASVSAPSMHWKRLRPCRRKHSVCGLNSCAVATLLAAVPGLAAAPRIAAPAYIVLNPATGETLAQRAADRELPMASTTKMWKPSSEEVRRIVAELVPVIDECVRRSACLLAGTPVLAEVDGNRTRRTGITRATRFEGGGRHQVA